MIDELPRGYEVVSQTRHRKECRELRLVLTAAGIDARVIQSGESWLLLVKTEDTAEANAELTAYRLENAGPSQTRAQNVRVYGGAAYGAVGYAVAIILVDMWSIRGALNLDWHEIGRVHAEKVVAGQWWRSITALTLHADAAHLLSNVLFGVLFGFLAGRLLGGGVAWLAIVIAGALGNAVNSLVRSPDHLSIGASTAVFASLGIMVSHSLRPEFRSSTSTFFDPMVRWSPLIGGVLLLGMTGIGGERTDVLAHVTGFLAGLVIGWIGCRIPEKWLASSATQLLCGVIAIGIVMAAWIFGARSEMIRNGI